MAEKYKEYSLKIDVTFCYTLLILEKPISWYSFCTFWAWMTDALDEDLKKRGIEYALLPPKYLLKG